MLIWGCNKKGGTYIVSLPVFEIDIFNYKVDSRGTQLLVSTNRDIGYVITDKHIKNIEVRFDDGRHISAEQRKKAYATMKDIADWSGYMPEEQKEHLKWLHMIRTGSDYFLLSDCSMDTAREFINTILEYAIENGVPLTDLASSRTDDYDALEKKILANK